MTRATLVLPSGTKLTVEGTPDEVRMVLEKIERSAVPATARAGIQHSSPTKQGPKSGSLGSRLIDLRDEGFFSQPRELSAINVALAEKGHRYSADHLSVALLRAARSKILRRIASGGSYIYVNP